MDKKVPIENKLDLLDKREPKVIFSGSSYEITFFKK